MAHNRVELIARISLLNSGADLDEAQVVIEVRDDEGAVSHEFVRTVVLPSNDQLTLRDAPVRLDPAAFLQVRDPRPGVVSVSVISGEEVLGSATRQVTLLAGNQWLAQPPGLAYELLTSFVMPNDPALGRLLSEAADILGRDTGSASMEGYQSGDPARVDAIAKSVWDATQRRHIRYAEPPASWWEAGQKVRSPAEVLEGRIGTCLDTTLLLAAALEQAGLRPLLWVLENHAFLGYWRSETSLDGTKSVDAREVMNAVDLDQMRLVESTAVTAGESIIPFGEASRLAAGHLKDGLDVVSAVVDVWVCRRIPIFPLPVRRATDSGVQIIEYHPKEHSPRQFVFEKGKRISRPLAPSAPGRVQQWKNSLLDLSLRNRLINYTERAGVRLRVPEGQLGRMEDLLYANQHLGLRPSTAIEDTDAARGIGDGWALPENRVADLLGAHQNVYTDVPANGYLTRMRNLAYRARTIQEETGANNLYLALGSLVWSLDGRKLRSPLILVPVKLTTKSKGTLYRLELDDSGGSTPNYCLLEKLRQIHGLTIPALANPPEDLLGIDLEAALKATREALADHEMAARVEPSADLSILQFAKFRLWKDLDEQWETLSHNALVRHLIESPTEPFVDPALPASAPPDLDALDAACPIPVDASQLEAVADATAGRTFVLEGPPGTGKSQTITNLLTRAVAEGKRVLFVAEKRAALDVVSTRLDAIGMGPFSLDLHDKGSKPAVVRGQILRALDHTVEVDRQGLSAREESLRSSRRTLARYSQHLHEENAAGLSYYSARTSVLTLGTEGSLLPVPLSLLASASLVEQVRRILQDLPDSADLAQPGPDHPWGFVGLCDPGRHQVDAVLAAAADVDDVMSEVSSTGPLAAVLGAARTPDEISVLAGLLMTQVSLGELDAARSRGWELSSEELLGKVADFVATVHPGLDVATPEALDMPLADIHAQALAADSSGFFGRGKRRKAVLARVRPVLRPGSKVSPKNVATLTTALMQLQEAIRGLAGQADGIPGLRVPETWNPYREQGQQLLHRQMAWVSWASRAVASRDDDPFNLALRDWLRTGAQADQGQADAVRSLDAAFRTLYVVSGAGAEAMARWSGDVGFVGRWLETNFGRGSELAAQSLQRWCTFITQLQPMRAAGLGEAADALVAGAVQADDGVMAFERGLALTSLHERRSATGLDGFDGQIHNRVVERFTSAVRDVRLEMTTAIPAQVITARSFKASTARGQVGELQRELVKQRRGLGVRALMQKYGDLITQLMPCVLVSPDSVARFFPIGGQQFDMVVFDEASQIRVADAIGAMGRAKSVVVVGDSKQMPPSTFAEPKAGPDDELAEDPETVEDEESILTEAVLARVPQRWLTWHYRSQDESLIAFSNAHYYESKLSSFPAPPHSASGQLSSGVGVSLVKVNGTFLRSGAGKLLRTNPEEAAAIFTELQTRFAQSPERTPSLGVVTFNQQQRAFIEALIRDSQNERMIAALDGSDGEGLFIKNLENVQGDERDVILFTTGFSVNDKGVLPLNFGPLTRAGGERRLNVAITRARRQVIVFTSFDPSQVRVEETQSKGIRHLRAYMELAAYGAGALDGAALTRPVPDRHRDEIAARLRERDLIVQTGVGLSDFRVDLTLADPADRERPLVAVLLDGPGWAARRTVGDRDGLPVQVLENLMKWPAVERVWMPNWLSEPANIVNRLLRSVSDARAQELARPLVPAVSTPEPLPDMTVASRPAEPVVLEAMHGTPAVILPARLLDGEQPFVAYVPKYQGLRSVLDDLPSSYARRLVSVAVEEVVTHEGPVHLERVARLVAASFGLTRLNSARTSSIINVVPQVMRRDLNEPFAWPAGVQPEAWTNFRSAPPDSGRPLEHIALREIGNAMAALCRDAAGIEDQELAAEALAVFGFKRRTSAISARLAAAMDAALSRGLLTRSPSGRIEAT